MVDKRIYEMRSENRKATDIAWLVKKLIATHTTISTMEGIGDLSGRVCDVSE